MTSNSFDRRLPSPSPVQIFTYYTCFSTKSHLKSKDIPLFFMELQLSSDNKKKPSVNEDMVGK